MYGIPTTSNAESSNILGVSGFIEQFANQADLKVSMCELLAWPSGVHTIVLQTFLGRLRTDLSSSTTFTLQTLDGGTNSQSSSQAGVEAVSHLRGLAGTGHLG